MDFFVPNAAVYHSYVFVEMMGRIASQSGKFSMKQTDKALIVNVVGVENVFEALYVLEGLWG
jgi:hypothetical protein